MKKEENTKYLTVEKWCEYAKAGVDIPVTTLLHGASMEPLIRYRKDAVTVVPLKRECKQGDIVLFKRRDGAFVVHRVFRISPDGTQVQTWGDNNRYPDMPIPKEDVLGLVVKMEKRGKVVPLDTDGQRAYGIKWMCNPPQRRLWFAYRRCYDFLGNLYVRTLRPWIHRNDNE